MYIDIGRVNYTKKENLEITERMTQGDGDNDETDDGSEVSEPSYDPSQPAGLLKSLQDVEAGVDEKMRNSTLRLFRGSKPIRAGSDEDDEDSSDSDSSGEEDDEKDQSDDSGSESDGEVSTDNFGGRQDKQNNISNKAQLVDSTDEESESSSDDDDDDDEEMSDDESEASVPKTRQGNSRGWKTNLGDRAADAFLARKAATVNLQEIIYGTTTSVSAVVSEDDEGDDHDDESSDDEFFKVRKARPRSSQKGSSTGEPASTSLGEEDSSRVFSKDDNEFDIEEWLEEGEDCLVESLRNKFVTGDWGGGKESDEAEEYGDFEDLETGEKFGPNGEVDSDEESADEPHGMTDMEMRAFNAERKAQQKVAFDEGYDDEKKSNAAGGIDPNDESAENDYMESIKREKEARLRRNQDEFGEEGERSRLRHEGFRQGLYCRIRLDGVPASFLESFNPEMPLVLGGLTPQESNIGLIRCRFKKHRWHKKILKCNDPLVFSIGWRRFQSVPVFSMEDQNGRHR